MAEQKVKYIRLGSSGLKVSRIILGCMSYGSKNWSEWVLEEEEALPLLKAAYDKGINTWDTANIYSNGTSEMIIGKAIKKYNIPRRKLVIMSKCFMALQDDPNGGRNPPGSNLETPYFVNQNGLSRKHIFEAVEGSLARLGTDYHDVLQIHRHDPNTPHEETMRALHDIVQMGKVRYIGASSMYAYQFLDMQHVAERNGWTKFISMQNYHNLLYREEEREMMPACKSTGVGLIPWSPVARGALTRPADDKSSLRAKTDGFLAGLVYKLERESDKKIIDTVERVAKRKGVSMAQIAIAYSLTKVDAPIVGLSKVERIDEMLDAMHIELSPDEIKELEEHYIPRTIQGHT